MMTWFFKIIALVLSKRGSKGFLMLHWLSLGNNRTTWAIMSGEWEYRVTITRSQS
jgi:hypothetical protein